MNIRHIMLSMINTKGTRIRKSVPIPAPAPSQAQSVSSIHVTISAEITRQLRELKAQLNREMVEDLNAMQANIMSKLGPMIEEKVAAEVDRRMRAMSSEVDKKVAGAVEVVAAANNRQLVVARESTRELVRAASMEICDDVYERVIGEINEKVVPKVDNMMQWVNYKTRDEDVTVDLYRRAVEHQSTADRRAITDGKNDKRIITPHVRTFFGDED